jgi:hypothetical protein
MTLESARTQRDVALEDAHYLYKWGRWHQAEAAFWVAGEFQVMIDEFENNKANRGPIG